MTTAKSPLRVLRSQASMIAVALKAAERGEKLSSPYAEKLIAARLRESVKFGVVMDDKVLTIEMTWSTIKDTSTAGVAEFILNQMKESRHAVH